MITSERTRLKGDSRRVHNLLCAHHPFCTVASNNSYINRTLQLPQEMIPPIFALVYAICMLTQSLLLDIPAVSSTNIGSTLKQILLYKTLSSSRSGPGFFIKTKNDAFYPIEEYQGTCSPDSLSTSPAHSPSTIPGLLLTTNGKQSLKSIDIPVH